MTDFIEKRKHKRLAKKMVISIIYRSKQYGRDILIEEQAVTEDIGAGGLRAILPEYLPNDKPLDLKVILFSDPLPLPAKGKVIWSAEKQKLQIKAKSSSKPDTQKKYLIGIQFVEIDSLTQERIIRMIKKELLK